MLKELKERKKLKAIMAALACGMVFAVGGQAEAGNLYGAGGTATSESAPTTPVTTGVNMTITGGTWDNVYGGFNPADSGTVEKNIITIKGTMKGNVYAGFAGNSGFDGDAKVLDNKLYIDGGASEITITGSVYGGRTSNTSGQANNNEISIYGSSGSTITITSDVAAGSSGGSAEYNKVNLGGYIDGAGIIHIGMGKANIGGTLAGGIRGGGTSAYNTLNVFSVGNSASNISWFQNINFYIPADAMDTTGSNTMLTLTSGSKSTTEYNISAGVTNVGEVKKGSKITLINRPNSTFKTSGSYGTLTDGIMKVTLKLYTTKTDGTVVDGNSGLANKLIAETEAPATGDGKGVVIEGGSASEGGGSASEGSSNVPEAQEKAKSPVETQAAGVSLLNQGSDMLSTDGLANAAAAAALANEAGRADSLTPFSAIGGSKQRIQSGSHVDLNSWNINLGLAKGVTNKYGRLLFGPVLEYGHGSYDSYLDDDTHGSGKSKFFGGGLMARESYHDGLYVEGSLRAGRAKNDYSAFIEGKDMSYDNSATYLTAHLGVGKEVELSKKASLDYYGKLFYSHQNSSSATLRAGYTYDFDAVNSFRTRIGARYTHKLNDLSKIYAGLAWQHEFNSKCRATIHAGAWTNEAPAPSIKGETGILELGWKIKPGKGNFETGLGFTGSIGKQKGAGVNASFQWTF